MAEGTMTDGAMNGNALIRRLAAEERRLADE
jgi:hypothetical protein